MPGQRLPERVRAARDRAARTIARAVATTSVFLVMGCLLVACGIDNGPAPGDAERGARLFSSLPCSGCHGAMAQGQFGPALAGTDLDFEEVRRQVRSPRDQMPAFSPERVNDRDLRDIYAWLTTLPSPTPTPPVTLPPAEATRQALNRFYAEMTAADLIARMNALDEAALRVSGTVISVNEEGRYTKVRLRVSGAGETVDVIGLFDTRMQRRPFPAEPGDHVTVYGVGAKPAEVEEEDGVKALPQLQVLYVRAD